MAGKIILRRAVDSRVPNRLRYRVVAHSADSEHTYWAGSVYQVVQSGKWRMESDTRMSRQQRAQNFATPEEAATALIEFKKDAIDRWHEVYRTKKQAIDDGLAGVVEIEKERG